MHRKTITLTEQQESWVKGRIATGNFGNDSEYIRDLIRRDQQYQERLTELRNALIQGENSGPAVSLDMKAIKREARSKVADWVLSLPIKLTPQAEQDLIQIWQYSNQQWNEIQADFYLDKLEIGVTQIAEHPMIGVDYSHVRSGYRKFRIEHHNIFYFLNSTELTIIRVLHNAMDAESKLL